MEAYLTSSRPCTLALDLLPEPLTEMDGVHIWLWLTSCKPDIAARSIGQAHPVP